MADNQPKKSMGKKQHTGNKIYGVYIRSILNQKVSLLITEIGQNVRQILEQKLVHTNENKCIREGYIKPGSVNIISYSSGLVNAEWIVFETVFECMVCHPVEGMLIECVVKTITKAGIHAEVVDGDAVPVVVFVAKDHHNMNKNFNTIVENQKILVKVIGTRFELNDPHVSVIAQLLDERDKEKEDAAKVREKMSGGLAKIAPYRYGGDDEDVLLGGVPVPDDSDSDNE
jgi:DNA-directed RNA polymerase subunit E'/Rpb7